MHGKARRLCREEAIGWVPERNTHLNILIRVIGDEGILNRGSIGNTATAAVAVFSAPYASVKEQARVPAALHSPDSNSHL